jgi:hypothetical protein
MTYRLLITGSRDWAKPLTVRDELNRARATAGSLTLVHGACKSGADAIGSLWAVQLKNTGVVEEKHPAEWGRNGKRDLGAGRRRNAEMVAEGADHCIAFIGLCAKPRCPHRGLHGSHGATHAALLADEADIPVLACVIRPATGAIVRLRTADGKPRLKAQMDELYGRVTS